MSKRTQIVLATRNPGKVAEMQALLDGMGVELLPASQFPGVPEVEEDLPTLEGNARKKALMLQQHTGLPAVADDTGLEVDALGGRPGVHSARYAGPEANEASNRAKLRQELDGKEKRSARFRTVIAFADGNDVHLFEGTCEGHIIDEERGAGGFGYDALFVPEGDTRTFAEMSKEEKNKISHRARALRRLAEYLQAERSRFGVSNQ